MIVYFNSLFSQLLLFWVCYMYTSFIFYISCTLFFYKTISSLYFFIFLQKHKLLFYCIACCLCSLIGIPPFTGFWLKASLLINIVKGNSFLLSCFLIIILFLALFLYFTPLRTMYATIQVQMFIYIQVYPRIIHFLICGCIFLLFGYFIFSDLYLLFGFNIL